ncbi:MAG: histidine triad nucleotide-binding protein [Deltaproteobacteria bacterium]|nr:histidine triad nucleotide-binding protein [Deltaproteobacteria bacterium]
MSEEKDCIFCKIARGEIPSEKVYDDGEFFVIRDINPKAPSHLLVIPYDHIPTLMDVEDTALIGRLFALIKQVAQGEKVDEKGFRVVHNVRSWGGQLVYHLHFHVLGGKLLAE